MKGFEEVRGKHTYPLSPVYILLEEADVDPFKRGSAAAAEGPLILKISLDNFVLEPEGTVKAKLS